MSTTATSAPAAARLRSVDWSDTETPSGGSPAHAWAGLAFVQLRELGETETNDLRDLFVAKVNAVVWTAFAALLCLALGVVGLRLGWGVSTWMFVGLSVAIAAAAGFYLRQVRSLRGDVRAASVEVFQAPMPRRADGAPARRIEVESAGQRVSLETPAADATVRIEILPNSRRVWTIAGQRLP